MSMIGKLVLHEKSNELVNTMKLLAKRSDTAWELVVEGESFYLWEGGMLTERLCPIGYVLRLRNGVTLQYVPST